MTNAEFSGYNQLWSLKAYTDACHLLALLSPFLLFDVEKEETSVIRINLTVAYVRY